MKIIAPAALAAATLILTAAAPALADGDHHRTPAPPAGRQTPHTSIANSGYRPPTIILPTAPTTRPTTIDMEEDLDDDLSQGLLPRLVNQVL